MTGKCRICGINKKLTFEHVPPESAFNSAPIFIQKHYHLHDKESYLFGKRHLSNRGAGDYYTCISCNNNTGSWYGESYKRFSYIGVFAIKHKVYASKIIEFEYAIKPLNILKQILAMFMSIDSSGQLLELKGLKEFILDKDSNDLPTSLKVYLYHTFSKSVRNGWGFMRTEKGYHTLGELTFPPFGFVYTINSQPIRGDYFEITTFKNYRFNQTIQTRLALPFLNPKSYIPGIYSEQELTI